MPLAASRSARPSIAPTLNYSDDYFGRPRFKKFMKTFDQPGTVLDLGCGNGIFLNMLRYNDIQGLGVDYSRQGVDACKREGLDAIHADILEFTNDSANHNRFAGVMLADFVEHFDPFTVQQILQQTVQTLKPGAPMVIITPNSHSIQMNLGCFYESTIEHHNMYSVYGMRRFLQDQGMEIVESGVDPDSRYQIFDRHPGRWLRNLLMFGIGRILCGRNCWYECTYVVARKSGEATEHFAQRG